MKQIPQEKASAAQCREASSAATTQKQLKALAFTTQSLALLVAKNPKTSAPLLTILATTSTPKYTLHSHTPALGYSPWSEPHYYDWMIEEKTRREIAKHPNVSIKTLLYLACLFPEEASTHATFLSLVSKSAKPLAKLTPIHILALFRQTALAPWLKETAENLQITKARKLASDGRAPSELLRYLCPRRDKRLLVLLGKHHHTPEDLLSELAELPDFRDGLARTKRTIR